MLTEAILSAIVKAIIGYALEQSGVGDRLKSALARRSGWQVTSGRFSGVMSEHGPGGSSDRPLSVEAWQAVSRMEDARRSADRMDDSLKP